MPPFVGACLLSGFPAHSTTTPSWHELCAYLSVSVSLRGIDFWSGSGAPFSSSGVPSALSVAENQRPRVAQRRERARDVIVPRQAFFIGQRPQ